MPSLCEIALRRTSTSCFYRAVPRRACIHYQKWLSRSRHEKNHWLSMFFFSFWNGKSVESVETSNQLNALGNRLENGFKALKLKSFVVLGLFFTTIINLESIFVFHHHKSLVTQSISCAPIPIILFLDLALPKTKRNPNLIQNHVTKVIAKSLLILHIFFWYGDQQCCLTTHRPRCEALHCSSSPHVDGGRLHRHDNLNGFDCEMKITTVIVKTFGGVKS